MRTDIVEEEWPEIAPQPPPAPALRAGRARPLCRSSSTMSRMAASSLRAFEPVARDNAAIDFTVTGH